MSPDELWQQVLDEAWDSYRAGGYGVGVVVVDEQGELIGSAGNRSSSAAPGAAFAGHSEIRAMAKLSVRQQLGATLYTSLEPCVSCLGAAMYCRIAEIRFASRDLSFTAARAGLVRTPLIRCRVPGSIGPLTDSRGAFCRLLCLVSELENGWSATHGLEGRLTPRLLHLAKTCAQHRVLADGRGWRAVSASLSKALEPVVRELTALERKLDRLGLS